MKWHVFEIDEELELTGDPCKELVDLLGLEVQDAIHSE